MVKTFQKLTDIPAHRIKFRSIKINDWPHKFFESFLQNFTLWKLLEFFGNFLFKFNTLKTTVIIKGFGSTYCFRRDQVNKNRLEKLMISQGYNGFFFVCVVNGSGQSLLLQCTTTTTTTNSVIAIERWRTAFIRPIIKRRDHGCSWWPVKIDRIPSVPPISYTLLLCTIKMEAWQDLLCIYYISPPSFKKKKKRMP